jgi:hypothetical protein
MMIFRQIKQSIISILNAAAAGRYVVIKSQRQTIAANEMERKFVKVFYRSGNFPNSASTPYGRPLKHEMAFDIELSVAVKCSVDLSVINSELSTSAQRAAAMVSFDDACLLADDALDKLFDDVFQVIMNPANYDLGFTKYGIANRWIQDFKKDDALPKGEYAILTGSFQIACHGDEQISSETGTSALVQDATININGEQENNAGVSGNLGG